ncbi:hypothetical protein HanXRQr2_Chr11g0509251 [Helianthus annuus]|uniref:Uncharacterized protein n=1 Tax=Helianthus annuus TaxID=4232 RepID=A0A251TCI5_HELAN|nr:hypothetical protein HanXRQr2_Chr11g0509251 [Helianthus annuus]KAJ0511062.1 hypothetical protein HanIR_Chr11g0547751 [Helianthus annuus]
MLIITTKDVLNHSRLRVFEHHKNPTFVPVLLDITHISAPSHHLLADNNPPENLQVNRTSPEHQTRWESRGFIGDTLASISSSRQRHM